MIDVCLLAFCPEILYNPIMTPDILRFLLLAYILVSAMISLAYLGRRRLSIGEFFFWGILVLIIPIF